MPFPTALCRCRSSLQNFNPRIATSQRGKKRCLPSGWPDIQCFIRKELFLIILRSSSLSRHYKINRGKNFELLRAVDGIDLAVAEDTTVGIVGESGCGKSTLLRLLLQLEKPTAGEIFFRGRNLGAYPENKLHFFRKNVQAVFQDAASSLNPRLKIRQSVAEPLMNLGEDFSKTELQEKVVQALEEVGLDPKDAQCFPHEFSGGQQRRIALARALIGRPRLILCDEATSGLDVSVQAQLLNLLLELQQEHSLGYLFVSHDLSVVRYLCSQIIVMYGGRVVEELPAGELNNAFHPYTRALLSSEPDLHKKEQLNPLEGEPPDPAAFPPGCRFHPRCRYRYKRCENEDPGLMQVGPRQYAACWLNDH